ncbi:MAG TPA: hypothetical protein DDY13_08410 [Cytophagales bacterium]|nr:hypothetical protein [Cytophagales bacterium]
MSDGATWIRNWIKEAFPEAVSILDCYHAVQYLHDFAGSHFKKREKQAQQWVKVQKALLLKSKLDLVIKNIQQLAARLSHCRKTLEYYRANQDRMEY